MAVVVDPANYQKEVMVGVGYSHLLGFGAVLAQQDSVERLCKRSTVAIAVVVTNASTAVGPNGSRVRAERRNAQ